jgi:tRNA(adenine34) deaminase
MRSSLFLHSTIVKPARAFPVFLSLVLRDLWAPASGNSAFRLFSASAHAILSRSMDADLEFMQQALDEARAAGLAGEVPVGAVLVHDSKIVARSGNRTIRDCDPTAHAEIVVLREAARALSNYRLAATTLYVTIEPCSMCAGAIIQARVPRLVYGCDDPKGGAVRSCFEILSHPRINHRVEVTPGVLASDCAALIQLFFAERR